MKQTITPNIIETSKNIGKISTKLIFVKEKSKENHMEELKIFDIDDKFLEDSKYATIKTSKGDIKLKLYGDSAPQAVSNFATLSNSSFYKGLKFHRVIKGFMAQGGCPFSKDNLPYAGTGGPGYRIQCEVKNNTKSHMRGALSMAHAGRDTGGSQFFICFVPCPHLDGEHTVFGGIQKNDKKSFEVLDKIEQGDVIEDIIISKD